MLPVTTKYLPQFLHLWIGSGRRRPVSYTHLETDLANCRQLWLQTYGYESEEDMPASWDDASIAQSLQRLAVERKVKTLSLIHICEAPVETLWDSVRRFENPHNYYVDLSLRLWSVKEELLRKNS